MYKRIKVMVLIYLVFGAGYVFAGASSALEQAKSDIVSLIEQGDYSQAQVQMQDLIAGYPGHPDMPETLLWIAEGYFWSGQRDQAKERFQEAHRNHGNKGGAVLGTGFWVPDIKDTGTPVPMDMDYFLNLE